MASILPGFEYDIFISYRQKDNRSDRWVTNFVQSLREEIDATFKEEISIYFDTNPHDGLLETHDVDGSLKEKINCLVFIPIVSQTYCDPNSFAWQKEFLSFVEFAKKDSPGLDVKLTNGNVAKRVLPVRIHEIDDVDRKLFEQVIGGAMRPVDFIYKEVGVCRPLLPGDDRRLNQTNADYRNQVNKVALAIKDLLNAISSPSSPETKSPKKISSSSKSKFHPVFLIAGFLLVAISFAFWFFQPVSKQDNEFDLILDRAEFYLDEGARFGDERYIEQADQAILKVLQKDSLHERALFLMAASEKDTAGYYMDILKRVAPSGIYYQLTTAIAQIQEQKPLQAIKILEKVLEKYPDNKEALFMIAYESLHVQDYLNCYRYCERLKNINPKGAHEILSGLYLQLGDFSEAYRQIQLKQELQEFACNDVENFQQILLCEGNFEKLENLTDSLCAFSNCPDCDFWQLRAKVHLGKFEQAAPLVGPSLKKMGKITWRYPAFVLLKNGKTDSANLVAKAELEYDQNRLFDTTNTQSIYLYSMSAIHAMQGNAQESIRYLRQYASKGFELGSEWYIAHDPLFDDLQKDNEFFTDFIQLVQKEQLRKTAIREELRKLE